MALLKLDERSMTVNVIAGVVEDYTPNTRAKGLSARVNALRETLEKRQKEEKAFIENEVLPELQAIRKEVQDINEERYPELKELREKQEAGEGK